MNNGRRLGFRLPRLSGVELRILTVDSPKLCEGRKIHRESPQNLAVN